MHRIHSGVLTARGLAKNHTLLEWNTFPAIGRSYLICTVRVRHAGVFPQTRLCLCFSFLSARNISVAAKQQG